MNKKKDPFILPTEPKNSWQMVGWAINEFTLLQKYFKTLSKKELLYQLLKAYFTVIVPICLLLCIIFIVFVISIDLASIIPSEYKIDFIKEWSSYQNLLDKFIFIINQTVKIMLVSLAFSLVFILLFTLLFTLLGGLVSGLTLGVVFGVLFAIVFGVVSSVALFILIYYLILFRLCQYPSYLLQSPNATLISNPYLNNESIFFPLFITDKKLIEEAKKNPSLGLKFSNFLYRYRKFNYKFGAKIRHASYSGFLIQNPLKAEILTLSVSKELKPSDKWYAFIGLIEKQIISYEKETQISIKKERFDEVIHLLEQWRQQNLVESPKWNHYYFDAIDKWIEEANKVAKLLEFQQQSIEPIQRNIYRYGIPLHPNRDELIFLGREDIKRELSIKIFTNDQIPAFMIQGQRRVGKTSLINFLPELLGSRFRVVSFDCQGVKTKTLGSFLTQLSEKINQKMALEKELSFGREWIEDWNIFEEFLKSIVLEDDIKLLIVLDEYEVLHQIFEQNPKEAEFILGRLRHFLQHQNSISFIFVGLYTFSDLENPNWSDYLVHYERFKVGYLNDEDSIKLITKPTKDFRLKYAKEVADRLYYYTAGHPALIQLLCNRIVDISNKNMDSTITMEIVENMVKEVALDKELYPALVFWKQLCTDEDKVTIREILTEVEVSDKRSLYKLEDYGFVVDGEIRVPIFRIWLERFEGIL